MISPQLEWLRLRRKALYLGRTAVAKGVPFRVRRHWVRISVSSGKPKWLERCGHSRKNNEGAEPLYLLSLALLEQKHGKNSDEYAEALWRVAQFYTNTENYSAAIACY